MLATAMVSAASAQEAKESKGYNIDLTGSIQSDILIPQDDKNIGTEKYDGDVLTNTYVELHALSKYVDAGARFEYLDHPLPGFEKDFKGKGVPFYYIKGKLKNAELTLGNYYEQFGSGFILRTYEERSLGIDNSLLTVLIKAYRLRLSLANNAAIGILTTLGCRVPTLSWAWQNGSRVCRRAALTLHSVHHG